MCTGMVDQGKDTRAKTSEASSKQSKRVSEEMLF